jgi:[protein-PII] uridylyltransferase
MVTADEVAGYLQDERASLVRRILHPAGLPAGGFAMAHAFSDLMDRVIRRLFFIACAKHDVDPVVLPIALAATGGYGRRELSPYSDIDITFIPQRDGDTRTDKVIRDLFALLMEVGTTRCGLEVGYAYRLFEDCTSLDHQTASGLLDARFIAGSERLFIQFEDAYWSGFNAPDFIFTKLDERRAVLQKWGSTTLQVEPNLKEGPGGLRDIHTMVWLIQARQHLSAARVRGDRAWEAISREMELSPRISTGLGAAKERILQIRNCMHAAASAERDQLVVTRQEEIADLLGYMPDDSSPPLERLMADLYKHLKLVRRVARQTMEHVENCRLIVGVGLDCRRRKLVPANESLSSDDPTWLLLACELAQKYGLEFSRSLENLAIDLVEQGPCTHDDATAAQCFTRILSNRGRVYPTLQRMADLGILEWYLPEFRGLMNLIPYDPAHDYTVGQHTLFVVRNLETILSWTNADGEEAMEFRQVLEDLPHPERLMLAAVVHDCGKSDPEVPHAESGEVLARSIANRLGWDAAAGEDAAFLVRHHLLMAETSRLRDLNLDSTISDFCKVVNDEDRLNMLYLLTYADTRAVGEGVWTSVKGKFLRELWLRAGGMLYTPESGEMEDKVLMRAQRRLHRDLTLQNLPADAVSEHIAAMPAGYLLNQSPNRIAVHIGFVDRVRKGEIIADFQDEPRAAYTELTVVVPDSPGLLSRIAGVLYHAGVVVHGAQVATRVSDTDRIALDILWVEHRGRQLLLGKQKEIRAALLKALAPGAQVDAPVERPPKPVELLNIRNDISDSHTVIETAGPDEQGALYWPSAAIARLGWDVVSARSSTWQGAVRAVFYVRGLRDVPERTARESFLCALNGPVAD